MVVVRRVGIFGGTFDPPHIGHLAAAVHARDQLRLDQLLLVVANDPWQKRDDRVITPAAHRLEMTHRAVEGLDRLVVSEIEIGRGGPSYTYDTVSALQSPEVDLVVIVGADAAAGLDTWHRADELAAAVEIGIIVRPGGHVTPGPHWSATQVEMPLLGVSSTDLRRRAATGASLDVLAPPAVVNYIREHGFYSR